MLLEIVNSILLTIFISIVIVFLITLLLILVKVCGKEKERVCIQKELIEPESSKEILKDVKQPVEHTSGNKLKYEYHPEDYSWIYQLRKRKEKRE